MADPTKACNLTKAEIKAVMQFHGYGICDVTRESHDEDVERINYLNKRLLSFGEVEKAEKTEDVKNGLVEPIPTPATKVW